MILVLRTDKPEAEIGLFNTDGNQLVYEKWQAHRELEATIFEKIHKTLEGYTLSDLTGLIIYAGPGSFTGLRIGFAVINTLAHELKIPNVKSSGEAWVSKGMAKISDSQPQILVPDYGGEANITKPKK